MDIRFPDRKEMPESDVVVWGGELTVSNLMNAYRRGIFPWPYDPEDPIPWCSPDPRAILRFQDFHVPKSLRRILSKNPYKITVDRAFPQVIRACARIRRRPELGTWIFPEMIRAYERLHRAGAAHSVEVWNAAGELVGGLYGVSVDGLFSGESMFHRESNTSKIAVVYLVEHLMARGLDWIDIQELSPHFERFGARTVSRADFLRLLEATRQRKLDLFQL